jgi:hypothetical protein
LRRIERERHPRGPPRVVGEHPLRRGASGSRSGWWDRSPRWRCGCCYSDHWCLRSPTARESRCDGKQCSF